MKKVLLVLLVLLIPSIGQAENKKEVLFKNEAGEVVKETDEFTGKTSYRIDAAPNNEQLLSCDVDKCMIAVRDEAIVFVSFSDTWKYLRNHDVELLVDGEYFDLEDAHDGSVHDGGVSEYIFALWSENLLKKLASAEKVKFRIGGTVIEYTGSPYLELIRKLYDAPAEENTKKAVEEASAEETEENLTPPQSKD